MKAFCVGNPFGFIGLIDEAQLLEHVFPALYVTKYIEQPILKLKDKYFKYKEPNVAKTLV